MGKEKLLEVNHLRTSFFTAAGEVKSVDDVSYYVDREEIIGVVGESGSGKSVTSLNPVFTVGNQLTEIIRVHLKLSKKEAWARAVEVLGAVGIPDPERRMRDYPFQMSGGMRQRVMIAMAISCNAKLIIADEPTTALDATIQAQVMELLVSLVKNNRTSLIVVTHNLGLIARYAQRIYVMYAGKIIESGTTEDILSRPQHPYTKGLLRSVPRLDTERSERLIPIEGMPPNLAQLPETCAFLPRCPFATDACRAAKIPQLKRVGPNEHFAACHLTQEEVE